MKPLSIAAKFNRPDDLERQRKLDEQFQAAQQVLASLPNAMPLCAPQADDYCQGRRLSALLKRQAS